MCGLAISSSLISRSPRIVRCDRLRDVLEHLREPGRVLKQIREWLAPDGCIVASIPNVRHHSVVRSLLQGKPGPSGSTRHACAQQPGPRRELARIVRMIAGVRG